MRRIAVESEARAGPGEGGGVRYEPHESPSYPVAFGLAFQYAILSIGGIVLSIAIVVRAAGESESYLAWGAAAALLVSGVTTWIQSVRVGRVGAGYFLVMGTSGAFIAVSVSALAQGGPGLLATLVVASSLFQFALASRLSLLRRIVTPAVAGTVIMLIAVTVMPIVFGLLGEVPAGTSPKGAPLTALTTIAVTLFIVLRASGTLRLWGPVIGIVAGCVTAAAFGMFDLAGVAAAPWVGIPVASWPGFDFEFGAAFWVLLPAFVFVTLVGAIETVGDGVAIQRISWRKSRATDFQAVQGAVAADGVGNLLSGLVATVPNTTYSSSVSIAEVTGIASRRVGACVGITFILLALLPKASAFLLAVPNPVIGTYALVLIAILFVLGARIVVTDGLDYRKAAIVGVAFWIGTGFQNGLIFPESIGGWAGGVLENGMTAGGLAALLLTVVMEMAGRRRRVETTLDVDALPKLQSFLSDFAASKGLGGEMPDRLHQAAEETLLVLLDQAREGEAPGTRRLRVMARAEAGGAELEFLAAAAGGNIEDRMAAAVTENVSDVPGEGEISLRLLRHFATSVRHQKYYDVDIVTVRVDPHPARS